MSIRFVVAATLVAALASCSLDLEIPEVEESTLKGVIDPGGHVSAMGLPVKLVHTESGERIDVVTDATGAFVRSGLKPGAWLVTLDVAGFVPLREGPFALPLGQTLDVGTLKPVWLAQTQARGSVHGRVLVNGGELGALDGGSIDAGAGKSADAQGAKVECLLGDSTGQLIATAVVDAFGEYWLEVPPGLYTLRATHPFFVAALRANLNVKDAEALDLRSEPLVMELNPAELSGSIRREVDLQETTLPAEGALIVSDTGVTATVDAQGNFRLPNLAAGDRSFTIVLTGYADPLPMRRFTLAGGERRTISPITVTLLRGSVTGEVEMADNTPLDQVTVSVPGTPYAAQVAPSTSDATRGRFVLERLPLGAYTVRAARQGYIAAMSATVTVAVGVPVDVGLLRLARVQGDFVIDDGDATNLAGYTRTQDVTLVVNNVANAAEYRQAEGSASALSSATWQPFTTSHIAHTLSAGDGLKTVFLQFRDASNNESSAQQSSVFLDQTAPSGLTVSLASGRAFTNQSNPIPVSVVADETGSGISDMHLTVLSTATDGGELLGARQRYLRDTSFTRPASADGGAPSDGPFRLYAQVVDNAGNVSAIEHDDTTIDTVAPTGTITVQQGARATLPGYTNTVQVVLSETIVAEPFSGTLDVRLANDAIDLPTATLRPAKSQEGWVLDPGGAALKTVSYQFVDAAGNVSAPQQASITLDVTPPVFTVTLNSAAATSNQTVDLTVSATDDLALSPTQALTLSESALFTGATAAAMPPGGLTSLVLGSAEGVHTVYVRVRDAAGNEAVDDSVSVTLDRTAPEAQSLTLTGTLGDGSSSTSTTSASTVTVTLSQSGASLVRLGDSTQTDCTGTGYAALTSNVIVNHPLPGSGPTRTVTACLGDAAGNRAGPLTASITYDGTTPTGCSLLIAGRRADGTAASAALEKTALRETSFTLTGCSEVPSEYFLTDASTVTCDGVGMTFSSYSAGGTPLLLSSVDGQKTLRGCVRDAARNIGSIAFDQITLDTTPPSGGSVTIDNGNLYVNASQVTSRGGYRADVSGSATGAVDWAIGLTAAPTSFSSVFSVSNFNFGGSDGTKTIYAVFRDDVGNSTAAVTIQDSIVFDTQAPVLGSATLTLVGPTQNDYTNTQVVVARVASAPSDATTLKYAERGTVGTCAVGDVSSATAFPVLPAYTVTLTAAEVQKRFCLQFFDAANNGSSLIFDDITLDRTPPTTPQLTTLEQYVSLGDNATFTVNIGSPSIEPALSFARYEKLGGKSTSWATASTTQSTTAFTFNLHNPGTASTAAEDGVRNELRLRAVDLAGNTSGESVVFITADINPPDAVPAILDSYVDNANVRGTIHWRPSPTGAAGYRLYYGTSTINFAGTYANEGNSPIDVGGRLSFTLSGLTNQVATYVRIAPYDLAGNVGPQTPGGYQQAVTLLPGVVSPGLVADLPLAAPADAGYPQEAVAMAIGPDGYAYILGRVGTTCGSAGTSCAGTLRTVDLNRLESPIQRGVLNIDAGQPLQVGEPLVLADQGSQTSDYRGDVFIDGQWMFLASGRFFHVVSLSDPALPALTASIDLSAINAGYRVTAVPGVLGDYVVVGGDNVTTNAAFSALVNISSLHDGVTATKPAVANVKIINHPTSTNAFAFLLNDRLIHASGGISIGNLHDGIVGNTWDSSDVMAGSSSMSGSGAHHIASGNYVLSVNYEGLGVYDVTSMLQGGLAASLLGTAAVTNGRVFDFLGRQAFVPSDGATPRLYDLTSGPYPTLLGQGTVTTGGSQSIARIWGPYGVVAHATSGAMGLKVFEIATPRALTLRALAPGALGAAAEHRGGLKLVAGNMYAGSSQAFDLMSGLTPAKGVSATGCETSTAWFDDTAIGASGNTLVVTHLDKLTDRNALTSMGVDDRYIVSLPVGSARATSVAGWGNYLIVAEVRSDGIWLEVFDIRKARDKVPTTKVTGSDSIYSAKVVSLSGDLSEYTVDLTMNSGVAAISIFIGYFNFATATTVQFFDLRPLFDDDSSTSLSATSGYAGGLTAQSTFKTVIRGSTAYMTSLTGFGTASVAELFDGVVGTQVPTNRTITYTLPQFSRSADIKLYGTRAFVGAGVVLSYDVTTPTNVLLTTQATVGASAGFCSPTGDTSRELPPGLDVAGSQLFINSGHVGVFDLE